MIKSFLCLTGAVVLSLGLTGCAHSQSGTRETASSTNFEDHIQPALEAKCTSCHGATRAAEDLRLDSWTNLFVGADDGEAVIPFDAQNSLLMELSTRLVGGVHPAELGGDTLTYEELEYAANMD